MTQYGTWTPYAGAEAIRLAIALFLIAIALAFFAVRLRSPLQPRQTGRFAGGMLALIWLVSIQTFGMNGTVYWLALVKAVGKFTPPNSPITPITFLAGLLGFITILVLGRRSGWKVALGSAVVGMMAAPMIFELPFDLIVMGRIYPTPPTPVAAYTQLYFLPLFLIALSSFALVTVSPLLKLSRWTLFCLAGLFLVFAVWALFGFSYPSSPLPFSLNAISKVLAFLAAVTLFLPRDGTVSISPIRLS
jgi:hypothetical protein